MNSLDIDMAKKKKRNLIWNLVLVAVVLVLSAFLDANK